MLIVEPKQVFEVDTRYYGHNSFMGPDNMEVSTNYGPVLGSSKNEGYYHVLVHIRCP